MHRYLPEAQDEHLFTLEMLVRARVKEANMCLITLMGNRDFDIKLEEHQVELAGDRRHDDENNARANNAPRQNSFEYTSRVSAKTLRCLKM